MFDFTNRNALECALTRFNGSTYVTLRQFGGSMHFTHTMTPQQARQLASTLVLMASDAEPARTEVAA